jgi:hypothetical protein
MKMSRSHKEWTGFNASVNVNYLRRVKIGKINFKHLLLSLSPIPPMPQARVYTTSNGWAFCWLCWGGHGPQQTGNPRGADLQLQTNHISAWGGATVGGATRESWKATIVFMKNKDFFHPVCSAASRNFLSLPSCKFEVKLQYISSDRLYALWFSLFFSVLLSTQYF